MGHLIALYHVTHVVYHINIVPDRYLNEFVYTDIHAYPISLSPFIQPRCAGTSPPPNFSEYTRLRPTTLVPWVPPRLRLLNVDFSESTLSSRRRALQCVWCKLKNACGNLPTWSEPSMLGYNRMQYDSGRNCMSFLSGPQYSSLRFPWRWWSGRHSKYIA